MAMYTCRDDAQRKQINAFMTAFQEHPQAWTRVDTILESTKCDQSKFFVRSKQYQCGAQHKHHTHDTQWVQYFKGLFVSWCFCLSFSVPLHICVYVCMKRAAARRLGGRVSSG